MRTFWEWLFLTEGDEGLGAFIASQNWSVKVFLKELLAAGKITHPQLVREAEALIADRDNHLFDYGRELLRLASGGRGRLAGGDTLEAATEAAGRMWEILWRPDAYAGAQTWESRFPMSVQRGGIRGTVRAFANYLVGHFAQRLRKSKAGVSTVQRSQIEAPIDPPARAATPAGEWDEWRTAILRELINDLHSEEEKNQGGKHWRARLRNLRWAIAIAEKQMAIPYQWRSMREVMAEIPGLQGIPRGGLQQALKALIDDARSRVVAKMGSDREQAVAHWLQARRGRTLQRAQVEGRFLPVVPQPTSAVDLASPPGYIRFQEYVAAREALLLPDKLVRTGMTRINPFPATQRKLKRLFPVRPVPANSGGPVAPPSPISPRPTPKPVPSPLQAAKDAFAGYY